MYSNGDDPLFTNAEQQPDKEPSTRSNSITPVEEPVEDPPEEPVELGKISAGICIVDIHFSSSELIECVRVDAFPHSVSMTIFATNSLSIIESQRHMVVHGNDKSKCQSLFVFANVGTL